MLRLGKHGLQQFVPRSPGVGRRPDFVAGMSMLFHSRTPWLFWLPFHSSIFWSLTKKGRYGLITDFQLTVTLMTLTQLTQLVQISPYLWIIVSLWLTKSEARETWTVAILLAPSWTLETLVVWTIQDLNLFEITKPLWHDDQTIEASNKMDITCNYITHTFEFYLTVVVYLCILSKWSLLQMESASSIISW